MPVISPAEKLSVRVPDNRAAFDELRMSRPVLAGTANTLIIEDRSAALSNRPADLLICDWDETVSLIKCGWNIAMMRYVAKLWAMPAGFEPASAWSFPVEATQEDNRCAEEYVRRTTGTLTQVQYATAIHLKQFRVPHTGGIERTRFEEGLNNILLKSRLDFTSPLGQPWDVQTGTRLWELGTSMYAEWKTIMKEEFRDRRLLELRTPGMSLPEEYLVRDAVPFLEKVRGRGIKMYALSGSEESEVEEDSKALGIHQFFEVIFGANGTLERETDGALVYSKLNGSNFIMDREEVPECDRDRVMFLGDGPSEMKIGASLGGLRVGMIPAHTEDPVSLAETLIANGAQYLKLGGFSDHGATVPYFFGR